MKAKKFLALVLTLALMAGYMAVPVLADGPGGPAPAPGLTIVDGSCGTLVTATEETAFITLENQSAEAVAGLISGLDAAWKAMGCAINSPYMTLALIPLACIPELRLTNRGLVDCRDFRFVPLFVD